jgi:hypothetical protein
MLKGRTALESLDGEGFDEHDDQGTQAVLSECGRALARR